MVMMMVDIDKDHLTSNRSVDVEKVLSPIQDQDLWFEDGNIVLVAGNTLFRVHRGVLAQKSAIFADLFAVPQPEFEGDYIEGCPTVELHDSSEEVSICLKAMYHGLKYSYREEAPTWSTIRHFLTFGTKYEVSELRKEAVSHLQATFPKAIREWDFLYSEPRGWMQYEAEEDIDIVNITSTFDLPDIRIAALYDCCSLPVSVLVHGYPSKDGTVIRLSQEDLVTVLEARERLVFARSKIHMDLYDTSTRFEPCQSWDAHCAAKVAVLAGKKRTIETELGLCPYDPLHPIRYMIEGECSSVGLCGECTRYFVDQHTILRQKIRDNLASYFKATTARYDSCE